jgi:tetratricopeptide (TPR) repeat protein
LAQAYNNLGILCRATGQTAAAAEAYRQAVNVMEELAAEYGANPAFRESVAKTWHNLGLSLGTSQPEEAHDALTRARGTFQELADGHPNEPKYQVDLAAGDAALGNLLAAVGRHEDAEPLLREAVELREKLAEQFPDDAAHQNSLAWLLANCADPALRDPAEAVELANRAVQQDPKRPPFWNTLGAAHLRAGEWASAIEALQESIELGAGGDGSDWLFLAMAYWQLGKEHQARKCYDRAVKWMDQKRPHDAEMSLLRDEAETLLEIDKPNSQ